MKFRSLFAGIDMLGILILLMFVRIEGCDDDRLLGLKVLVRSKFSPDDNLLFIDFNYLGVADLTLYILLYGRQVYGLCYLFTFLEIYKF